MAEPSILSSPAARVTLVMCCLFGTYGVMMPYLARWLEVERGLVGAQIGAVLALAQLSRIATGPAIAFWADGARDRRTPIRIIGAAAVISFCAFFFLAQGFPALLLVGFVAVTCSQSLSPFMEGALLRASESGRPSYGLARGVVTTAYIVANVAGGALIASFGLIAVVIWMLTALSLLFLTSVTAMPHDPPPGEASARAPGARLALARQLLASPRFLLLIVSCGLIQAAHAFYYSFSTLVWRGQGIDAEIVGVLWAIGGVAEVAFLWMLPSIERRTSPEALILLGGIGAALRWLCMGFGPTGWLLLPLQALHALSFASAHVGAMRLLFRETPAMAQGLSQTMYAALSGGLFMGLSTLGSGFLYDLGGAAGYWAMAAMAFLGTLMALPLFGSAPKSGSGAVVLP